MRRTARAYGPPEYHPCTWMKKVPVFPTVNVTRSSALGFAETALSAGQGPFRRKHPAVNWWISLAADLQTYRSMSLPGGPSRVIRYRLPSKSVLRYTSFTSPGQATRPATRAPRTVAPSMLPSVSRVAFVIGALNAATAFTRPWVRVNFPSIRTLGRPVISPQLVRSFREAG